MVLRHELQHSETMRQTMAIAGSSRRRRAVADAPLRGADRWAELDRAAGGAFAMGAGGEGFAYDNERPRHTVERGRLPDRPPPGEQRELDALQRGRRLRAARVVVGRGLGVEGGVRHHPSLRSRRMATPRRPSATSPGSRPTPSPERTTRACPPRPSGRGRRPGPSGRADPRARASVRCGSGRAALSAATPASAHTPTASTPRCSSASATACCAAARGPPTRAWPRSPSATGTCPAPADLRRRAPREGR